MRSALPLVFEFVLVLALVLMLYAFRSIVIAVKAIVLNLLSVAAAYGVLVLAFQHGWGSGLAARPRVLERRGDPPRHHLHGRRRDRRATMARLGERDWYLPRWLRWLPRPPAERLAEPAASARGSPEARGGRPQDPASPSGPGERDGSPRPLGATARLR